MLFFLFCFFSFCFMKRRLLLLLVLSSWLGLSTAHAQSTLVQESFETNGEGTRYTSNTFDNRATTVQYFLRAQPPVSGFNSSFTASGIDGSWLWAGEAVRGQTGGNPDRAPLYVQLNTINIANKSNVQVKVLLADPRGLSSNATIGQGTLNWENDDFVRIKVRVNGGSWVTVGQFVGDNAAGGTGGRLRQDTNFSNTSYDAADASSPIIDNFFKDFTFNVTGSGTTLDVMVEEDFIGGSEELAFDNIRVIGTQATTAAPVLANIESATLNYNEGDPATQITSSLAASDADSPNLTGGSVSLTSGFVSTQDRLLFTNQNNITGSYNTSNGVLTLSGISSVAAYQAALRSVQYQNTDAVTAIGGLRLANFSVTDGVTSSNVASRNIIVNAQLNAPAALPYVEDFETSGEGLRYATDTWSSSNPCLGFLRTSANPYACTPVTFGNISGSSYWYAEGTTNPTNPNPVDIGTMTLAPVNASAYNNLHFNIRLATGQSAQWESDDFVKFYYRVNGGSWVLFSAFYGNGTLNAPGELQLDTDLNGVADGGTGSVTLNTTLQNVDLALPPSVTGASVDFQILVSNDGQEELAFDRITIAGTQLAPPTVTTAAATSITTISAVLGGSVTADGGDAVTDRGVVYSTTNTTPAIGGSGVTQAANGLGAGTFSATISGLTPGTIYYVRAYATNSVGTSYGSVVSFTTPTTVVSIVRADPSPTNASQVRFTVTFASPVTGLTINNFSISFNGLSGLSFASLTGSGTTYTVTVNTGSGSGNLLRLNLANSNGLSPSVSGLPYTTGESYIIDRTAPTVAISSTAGTSGGTTSTTPIPYSVTFSEAVTGFVAGDVSVSNGTLSGFSGSGTTYSFNVTPTAAGTATTVNIAANVAQDNATNGNTAASQYSLTYSLPDATVASVTRLTPSPTATALVSYRVAFSAAVTGLSTSNFSLTPTGTITGASVSSVSGSGTTYTVVVNTGTGDGSLRLNVANGTGVSPTLSNVPYTAGEVYTLTKSFAANPQLTIQGTGGTGSDVTAFVDAVQVLSGGSPFANALQNNSFETHDPLANGDYGYNPSGASWTFNTSSGIAEAGSGFTPTTPIPSGIAVAFVQSNGGSNGQLQQNLGLPTGSYQVSFLASQRVCCSNTTPDQALNVFLNGVFIGTIQPPSTSSYTTFTSATFNVTAPALTASISSTAGTSGSTTATSPIPFTVTFSASVTGFTASDVTVANGTLSGFSGVGTTYTFNVTPSANGTVSVNVPANSAIDANNTGNTAASQFSLNYQQSVTAAPVVTAPANGSLINTTTPTYGGTAVATSTVTVFVDGTAIGTATTSASGSWSLPQPTALVQGSHTVYATAQLSGSAVSANSNTNTFILDSVRPTVAISSSAGASGSTTGTSPLPFTVTFSEAVTGFVAGDVSVTNGTISSVSGSGTTYTFSVTPTTIGTATTVNIGANVAQDNATNGNTAATQFSLIYQPTLTSWTGLVSTDWFTAGNWSAGIPTADVDATIPASAPNMPTISANAANARNLTVNSDATLNMSGGTLALAANLTNNGTFTATGGTVTLGVSTQANILGSSSIRFWNLTVLSNGLLLGTSAGASVRRVATLNGAFATQGNAFTLESNSTGTAMLVNNSNAVSGNVTVQRYISPDLNANLGYRHFSSPISTATVSSLATSSFTPVVNPNYNTVAIPSQVQPFPTVYGYDQTRLATATNSLPLFDKGWFSPSSLSDALTVGQGYTVNLAANQTLSLTGPQNNGNVTQNLGRNSGATAFDAGLALVGNPYPSPLDWSRVATSDRPGVDGVIYVFASNDPTNPYAGSYGTYNNQVGNISPLLPMGQGFFVRVSLGQTAGTLTFKNSHRPTTYSNTPYRRTTAETRPLVQLTLQGAGSKVSDDAFVYFENGATEDFDSQYDAMKLPNPNGLNLSTSVMGKQFSIDGRPEVGTVQRVIPLAVGVPTPGSYSLTSAQLLNLAATPVYLRDVQLGTLTDLRLTPSYQFTVSNASALITNRFELVFSPQQALATVPAALAQQVALYPNPAKKAAFVELPVSLGRQVVTASLVDALGRQVRTVTLPAQGALAHQLDLSALATGVYALHLSTSAGVVVKKLVIE
jgi:hypothetical protein